MFRFFLVSLLLTAPAVAADLRVGAAAVVITPPPGTPMAGYYSERGAEGVHDDLYAKALVLEKDGTRAALVSLDLISTTRGIVMEARREIEKRTSIPGANVLISASHTHTGPEFSSRGPRSAALGGQSDLALRYSAELPGKIALAVQQAEKTLVAARLGLGRGKEEGIAFNRRFHMQDGRVGWNPGILNPNILKAAGPIDPEVAVAHFTTTDKKPLATCVNYAVHLDNVGGSKISADMPAVVAKLLGELHGPKAVTVYFTGCCGDVNHINVAWGAPQKGHEQAARMGIMLTAEVLRTFPLLKTSEPGTLQCKSAIVPLPLPKISAEEIEKARSVAEQFRAAKGKGIPFLDSVNAFKVLDVEARQGKPHEVEVQVIALGRDIAWVSLPGEIFVELGLAIKQDSPFKHTQIGELANGSIGYIPTRRAYTQGNYEVISARCAEGSGELLVDAAVRLLKELYASAK